MGPHRPRAAALAALLFIAACSSPTPSPSPAPSDGQASPGASDPAASPGTEETPTSEPGASDGPPAPIDAKPGLVLAEVGFAHGDEFAFIELWNAGDVPIDLRDVGIAVDGDAVSVSFGEEALAADGRALLRFDLVFDPVLGLDVEPAAAHGPPEAGPRVGGGTIDLLDAVGRPVDHIAWGDEPDAVRTGLGGVVPEALEPDGTIGRTPGAWAPHDRLAWVPYLAAEATPGGANPLPAVPILLPFSGAVFDTPTADLTWYPAPGATGYRVQVASDEAFGAIVRDESVSAIGLVVEGLAPGPYWWRVQATGDDGLAAAFAGPASFEVVVATAGISTALARPGDGPVTLAGATAVDPPAAKHLNVPLLKQRKDSSMLLLERNVRTGPHPWDEAHPDLDTGDPSDNMNCVLASTAMLAAFACPDCKMSQDRIGYEVFKGRMPGPERDLNYGDGLWPAQILQAIEFALVASNPQGQTEDVPDRVWAALRAQIDLGRPVLVVKASGGGAHAFVITGYTVVAGRRTVYANDPWSGLKQYAIANSAVSDLNDRWRIYATSGPLLGRQQELSVTTDSDDDGVFDFDEAERFHTDPDRGDSDEDGVGDQEDIAASVFDATYGYAVTYRKNALVPRMDGRDFDRDGRSMELDPDSDEGGCKDGDEDADLLGDHDATESWNFDAGDDPCQPSNGTLTWTSKYVVGSTESWSRIDEFVVLTARLKPDPDNPTRDYLDDGSSVVYNGRGRSFTRGLGGCDDNADVVRYGGGRAAAGDIGGTMVPEYEPGIDAFGISIYALWHGTGRHSNCFVNERISGDGSFSLSEECWGLAVADATRPGRTFVFDCGSNLGAGWFGYSWTLKGTITIR